MGLLNHYKKEKTMKIKLTNKTFIEIEDTYNYVLKNKKVVGEGSKRGRKAKEENIGKEVERTVGYFPTLEQAVRKSIDIELCDIEDVKEAMELVDNIKQAVKAARSK